MCDKCMHFHDHYCEMKYNIEVENFMKYFKD